MTQDKDYDIDNFKNYFTTLNKDELVEVALNLSKDCARLRRELDAEMGVVR